MAIALFVSIRQLRDGVSLGSSRSSRQFICLGFSRRLRHDVFFSHCLLVDNIGGLREGTVTFEEVAAPPMTLSADTTVSDASDQFQA